MTGLLSLLKDSFRDIFHRPEGNTSSLDGLRALAILLVLGMHTNEFFLHRNLHLSVLNQLPPFKGGWVGVPLFFVLSGYLIGGQIWKEYLQSGTLKFGRFVLRRGFRIWPLYYFLACFFFFFKIGGEKSLNGFISNLLFLSNYCFDNGPIFGAWSISTEEHFYILTPMILLSCLYFFGKRDLKFFRKIMIISFFFPLAARYVTWNFILNLKEFELNPYMLNIYRPIHTNSEGLIIGMFIANLKMDTSFNWNQLMKRKWPLLICALVLMSLSYSSKVYFNFSGIALGFGALLFICLDDKNLISKFFSLKFFYPISKTSFAIYLVHIYLINYSFNYALSQNWFDQFQILSPLLGFGLVTVSSFIVSVGLYVVLERPFLKLRNKMVKYS